MIVLLSRHSSTGGLYARINRSRYQFPTTVWHENLGDPTLADAILDRVLHHAYRIELKGESLRRKDRKVTAVKAELLQ